ncbi:NAD(P)-dependent alcohol dehydrogenase [Leifsonia sp. A12D58]|uniref:NAD(P)-dependent alcohol dehydrogenase n=1 Tax=Leifsonia sp. A12D58 TaxID=3397674 RepID=UPI0039E02002
MRAAQIIRFGDWRAVAVTTTAVPEPGDGEVLVRVSASSLNTVDVVRRDGRLRMLTGRRLPQGLGIDMVGTVERTGAGVQGFGPGDRVWGIRSDTAGMKNPTGLTADYAVAHAHQIASAPHTLDDVQAAAFAVGGYTALRALRDVARLQPGERVLIRGGTGGVGSAAVQIAAALGGRVAVLASARNEQIARDLGAQEFFDYATASPALVGPTDVILDTVGTDLLRWRRLLTPQGRMVGVAFNSAAGLATIAASIVFGPRRIRTFAGEPPPGSLACVTSFAETHGLRALVHGTFPLEDLQDAHRTFDAQALRGKIVITVAS